MSGRGKKRLILCSPEDRKDFMGSRSFLPLKKEYFKKVFYKWRRLLGMWEMAKQRLPGIAVLDEMLDQEVSVLASQQEDEGNCS